MRRAGFVAVAVLIAIGLIAVSARTYVLVRSPAFLLTAQQTVFHKLSDDETVIAKWLKETVELEQRISDHDTTMLLHVLAGGAFLLFAPLQFSSRLRRRNVALHRWLGRALVIIAIASTLAGLFFGVVIPFGGLGEITSTGFFGGLFIFALVRAFVAIRARQVAIHREWMIRAFAIALGISTIRITASVMPRVMPMPLRDGIGPMFWIGWGITLIAGECWIRMSRSPVAAISS